jgi:hypothetical protein
MRYYNFPSISYQVNIMPSQDEHNNKTEQPLPSIDSDNTTEEAANPIKSLLIGIGGLILILSIFALLPMFFTYLSEGDSRAPSEIHATDTARKKSQSDYNLVKPEK